MKNILRPPFFCHPLCGRRGQRVGHCSLNKFICQFVIKFSLRPPCRRGQREPFLPLRNCRKLLKLLGIFTPPPPALRHKLTLGIGLVEVLIASVIGGVVMLGSIKGLSFALQAAQVSRSILTENDFRLTVSKALKTACVENLKPARLTGSNSAKGIGTLAEITKPSIGTGIYKKDVDVVKMELKGEPTSETRTFVAFYKKTGLGELNTVGNQECSATDTSGCFYQTCRIDYKFKVDDTTTTEDESLELAECNPFDCNESAMHLAGVNCENTHGHGFSVAGFDDSGQPICKNLTADANPCPFGTQIKGYKTDGRPDCTAKRSCQTGYLLQSDGSCFIKTMSLDSSSPESCIEKPTQIEARKVCDDQVNLDSYCYITFFEKQAPTTVHYQWKADSCAHNFKIATYTAKIFRRGPYNRETGNSACFILETPEFIATHESNTRWARTQTYPLTQSISVRGRDRLRPLTQAEKAVVSYHNNCYKKIGSVRDVLNESIDKIFTWKR